MNIAALFAPFTNKVHLVTLIMCVVLFSALRMSGGTVRVQTDPSADTVKSSVSDTKPAASARKSEITRELELPDSDAVLDPKSELKQLGISDQMKNSPSHAAREVPAANDFDSDSLEATLLAKKAAAENNAKAANTESGSSKNGLDDIEKRLGLK